MKTSGTLIRSAMIVIAFYFSIELLLSSCPLWMKLTITPAMAAVMVGMVDPILVACNYPSPVNLLWRATQIALTWLGVITILSAYDFKRGAGFEITRTLIRSRYCGFWYARHDILAEKTKMMFDEINNGYDSVVTFEERFSGENAK